MSKKHYEALAMAIASEQMKWPTRSRGRMAVGRVAHAIAFELARENVNFDYQRFIEACKTEQ